MPTGLHIAGYSVRAAAWSAWRGGLRCVAIDTFGDRDLRRIATRWHPADPTDWTSTLDAVTEKRRHCGRSSAPALLCWLAPFENHPEVLERAAAAWRIVGCPPQAVRRVRDLHWLAAVADRCGIAFPETLRHPPPDRGQWLFKPSRGGGGVGVRFADGTAAGAAATALSECGQTGGFFQRFIAGVPGSAVFLADRDRIRLLGWTRQLVGEAFTCAPAFAYCGTVAAHPTCAAPQLFEDPGMAFPGSGRRSVRVRPRARERRGPWESFAHGLKQLAREAGLRGLFGADFVFDGDRPWLVEINPRYTAAVEVLELMYGRSYLRAHLKAVGVDVGELAWCSLREGGPRSELPTAKDRVGGRTRTLGAPRFLAKVVLFAPRRDGTPPEKPREFGAAVRRQPPQPVRKAPWDAPESWADPDQPFLIPEFADVPEDATAGIPGGPWMTLFVAGDSPAGLWNGVLQRAQAAYAGLRHRTRPMRSASRSDEATE